MKVVLLKSVDNLGQAGEEKNVKRGYFRNFLEPRGAALEGTPNNLKLVESKRKKLQSLVANEVSEAQGMREKLDGQKLTFQLRAGDHGRLFGSITSRDLVDAMKSQLGVEVERRRIDMDNLKTLGDHPVKIRLYPGVTASVNAFIEKLVVEGEPEESEDQPKEVFGGAAIYEDED
ncbi:50S ribosomal protein L9 [soil metagenome]